MFHLAAARPRAAPGVRPAVRGSARADYRPARRQAKDGARIVMAQHPEHQPHHDDVAHEATDVSLRPILASAAGLLALGAVVYLVVWLFLGYLKGRAEVASSQLEYPLAVGQEDRLPPEPRLQ